MNILDDTQNPLNTVEEILNAQDWRFTRLNEDEIFVDIAGEHGQYKLSFIWQEKMSALQIAVQTDIEYSEYQYQEAASVISAINSQLWIGHFEIAQNASFATYRNTCLLRGMTSFNGSDYLSDLIEVALCECEKHYAELISVLQGEEQTAMHSHGDRSYNLAYLATAGNA